MSENWVRCGRCHEVFEAAEEVCPKCGTAYAAKPAQPREAPVSFADRYSGTEFSPPPPPPPTASAPRRSPTPFIVGGTAIVVAALVLAALSGAWNSPGPTMPPILIIGTPKPTPTPSPLPEEVAATIAQLSDPEFTTTIEISSRAHIDGRVTGQAQNGNASFVGHLSGADVSGVFTQQATSRQITFFSGVWYSRANDKAKWAPAPNLPGYLTLRPLLGLTKPEQLENAGPDVREGLPVVHLKATRYWVPDVGRVALMDLSGVGIKADTFSLDLWIEPDGTPVYAAFSATTTAADGTRLIDVQTTYTFTDVGLPYPIVDPLATPTPAPTPSPSAS